MNLSTEKTANLSLQQFEIYTEYTDEASLLIDYDLKIVAFSKIFAELYNKYFSIKVIKGKSILEYAQEGRKQNAFEIYKEVFKGIEQESEVEIPFKDDKVIFIHNKYKPIRNRDGKVEYAFVTCRDVTLEIESRKLQDINEKRYKSLVENSTDGIAILDMKSKLKYASPAIYRILGYTPEEAMQERIFPIILREDVELKNKAINKAYSNPDKPIKAPLIRVYNKKGELRWLESTITNMLHNDAVQGIVVNFRDQTNEYILKQEQVLISKLIKVLHKNSSFDKAISKTLKLLAKKLGHNYAEAWFVSKDNTKLYLQNCWNQYSKGKVLGNDPKLSFGINEGLPGACWESKKIELWHGLNQHPKFVRKEAARKENIKSGLALPIIQNENVIAIFTFFQRKEEIKLIDTTSLLRVAQQIGSDIQLKKSLYELNELYQFSPGIICVMGTDFYFKKVNPALCNLLKYSSEELSSKPFYEFLHPEEKELCVSQLKSDHINVANFGNRYLTKDGQTKWISWHSSGLIDREGNIYGFGTDLTDEKLANLELVRYKNVIEHSQSGVGIININDNTLYINPKFQEMLGYTGEEIMEMGGPSKLYVDENQADEVYTALRSGNSWNGEVKLKNKKGEILDLFTSGGIVKNENGEIVATYGIHTDISQRLSYEQELKNYSKKISNILESINDGFFSVDKNWKVNYWNNAASKLLDVNQQEMLGINIRKEFPETQELKFYKMANLVFKNKKPLLYKEYYPSTKSWFDINIYPSEEGISVFFRNITRINSQEKLNILEKQVLELFTRKKASFEKVIEFLLNGLKDIYPDMHCTVVKVVDDKLYNWSSPHLPGEFSNNINGLPVKYGIGSCGTAARLKKKVIVSDISTDELWKDIKDLAAVYGLKACWSFPIIDSKDNLLGTFGIYFKEKRKPTESEEQSIDRISTILKNIIENKTAEEAVLKSNERYNIVSRATNDAIWDWDLENDKIYYNEGYNRLFGYELGNDKHHDINDWEQNLHPEDVEETLKSLKNVINSKKQLNWTAEYRYRKIDGTYATVYDRGVLIRDKKGKGIRMIGAMLDISRRKQDEQSLRFKSNLLEASAKVSNELIRQDDWLKALETSFNIIGKTLKVDRVYYFENKLDEETSRYTTSQRIEWANNSTTPQINNPELQDLPLDSIAHFFEPLKENKPLEFIIDEMPDNRTKKLLESQDIKSILVLPIFIHKQFYGFIGFDDCKNERKWKEDERAFLKTLVSNVTTMIDRKKSRETLRKLNRKLEQRARELASSNAELEQFAYIASHDLQEPLRMVRSFLQQIEKKYNDKLDDRGRKYIHLAVDGAVRMRDIIFDFLEYSRAGREDYEKENIDLNKMLKDVIQIHQLNINDKGAKIEYDNLPSVFAAKTAIQQLLSNLIGNAVKYSHPKRTPIIKITAVNKEKKWEFAVTDNGIGIDPQFSDKIFVLFQRLHNRNEYTGTGIGLAICKKIIENHNGEIWFKSEPDVGSVFYFTIPE